MDLIPAEQPLGLQLYRHEPRGMVPDQNGTWVALKDARHQHNAMQSQLVSAGLGDLPTTDLRRIAHQGRGDILRIWQIIGDVNQRGVHEDIFERLAKLMIAMQQLRLELADTQKSLLKVSHHAEQKRLGPPT